MRVLVLCAILLASPYAWASEDGYVHGDNHCFYFGTPAGWVADHLSGRNQGLAFVFYPKGNSWADATTVIYAKVADKSEGVKAPKDQVARTLEQFRSQYESPNISAQHIGTVRATSGAVGQLYTFTGDKWGNTEFVAYFDGPKTINFFVMSSRDVSDLEKKRGALEELARSYREAQDCKPCTEARTGQACTQRVEPAAETVR
jgi:hypothetical protein